MLSGHPKLLGIEQNKVMGVAERDDVGLGVGSVDPGGARGRALDGAKLDF